MFVAAVPKGVKPSLRGNWTLPKLSPGDVEANVFRVVCAKVTMILGHQRMVMAMVMVMMVMTTMMITMMMMMMMMMLVVMMMVMLVMMMMMLVMMIMIMMGWDGMVYGMHVDGQACVTY